MSTDHLFEESPIGALYAYDIPAEGPVQRLDATATSSRPAPGMAYRWIHLDLSRDHVTEWLTKETDRTVAEAMTAMDTRPRSLPHANGMLLNLRGVNTNPASDPEDMVSIRMWITEDHIISVRFRRLKAVVAIREALEQGEGPRTIGAFIATLTEGLVMRMGPVVHNMTDTIDQLEENSLEAHDEPRIKLTDLRRTIIALKRYISPQREAIHDFITDGREFLSPSDRQRLSVSAEHTARLTEDLDNLRDRCTILSDHLADRRAEEMNKHTMVLSVVAAIFLPLGFLTGLLGVNIGGMPGVNWAGAFWTFCIMLIVIGLGLTLWFRRRKWF